MQIHIVSRLELERVEAGGQGLGLAKKRLEVGWVGGFDAGIESRPRATAAQAHEPTDEQRSAGRWFEAQSPGGV